MPDDYQRGFDLWLAESPIVREVCRASGAEAVWTWRDVVGGPVIVALYGEAVTEDGRLRALGVLEALAPDQAFEVRIADV